MDTSTKFGYYLENFGNPFIVGSLVTKKTFYVNKQMRDLFGVTVEDCDLGKIFHKSPERIQALMAKSLHKSKPTLLYSYVAITKEKEKILVDLQVGYFNEEQTEVFLEIIPQNDKRFELALHQIQNSPRAEAILNLDEKLSIVDCNEAFLNVFEASEELRHSHFKNDLVNGFLPELRESLIADIHKSLEIGDIFSTELKVITANGEEHWYRFDLQKRELDNSGSKLMCYMVNIEKQMETKENFDLVNQYLSVIQESTVDLLYRVDVATNTMYSYHEFESIVDHDKVIPDYVNTFFDLNTIHPEDKEIYLKGFQNFYENDILCDEPIRFSLGGSSYRWYKITGKKIYDNQGNLKEVFGSLVNVDKEVNIQDEFSTVHNYFEAFQAVSEESFCVINLEDKTVTQKGKAAKELGITEVLQNFPESMYAFIHPEDLTNFKAFAEESVEGDTIRMEVRMKTASGEYQWYELRSQGIKDKQGKTTELVGKINNIQKQKKMQKEVTLLTQYFDTMQSLSDESIYVFDLETKLLHLGGLTETELGLPLVCKGYPESFYPTTHPDDLENFKSFAGRSLHTYESRIELRLKNIDGSYQLYELLSNVIYDENGAPSKILGKVRNIQSKYQLKTEMEEINKFLEIMQELSDDILYRIDVDTKTLQFTLKDENGSIIKKTYENYPQSVINCDLIHPDDVDALHQQYDEFLSGTMKRIPIRLKLVSNEYLWYMDTALEITDTQGNNKKIYGSLKNIHKEVMAVRKQKEEYQHFTAMQDLSDDIFFRVDNQLTLYHNVESQHKILQSKVITNYVTAFIEDKIIHPEDVEKYQQGRRNFDLGESFGGTYRFAFFDERYLWYTVKARKIYDEDGKVVEAIGRLINVQKEHDMQSEYSALNQYFTAMQNLSQNILFHIDMKTKTFKHADKNALSFGLPAEIPNFIDTFIEGGIVRPEDGDKYREYTEKIMSGENMEYEIQAAVGVGVYEWFHITSQYIYNEKGEAVEIFGMMENIQDRKDLEQKASHDLMTKVLNKVSFEEESQDILEKIAPEKNHALIFIDLDDFKGVNDKLGHSYGDVLLTTVGRRLKRHVREGDLVGRIGGDEFAVFLCNIGDEQSVLDRTNTMLESVKRNFGHEGISVGIRASVGVAVYPQHGKNYKDLIGKSDEAVYESKRKGKNRVTMYSQHLKMGNSIPQE